MASLISTQVSISLVKVKPIFETGVFTCLTPGHYTISYTASAGNWGDGLVRVHQIYLYLNGQQVAVVFVVVVVVVVVIVVVVDGPQQQPDLPLSQWRAGC